MSKLRKRDAKADLNEEHQHFGDECGTSASTESVNGSQHQKDDGPHFAAETATEENEGQFENLQSKAIAGAKSLGNFLYSAVNKAGATVSEAGAMIKKTIEENSILSEFNKEQASFLKSQTGNTATALPPWVGCTNEETLKEECLSMSTDRRNFVCSPPPGVDFQFDYETSFPVAMAVMEQDPSLEKMRYELVPKVISEEKFWRNYFYRVSLICQANELSLLSREGDNQSAKKTVTSEQQIDSQVKELPSHEFTMSGYMTANSQDVSEIQQGMRKLIAGSEHQEEQWENELEAELRDYELVGEQKTNSNKGDNWKQKTEEMLEDDTDFK